MKTSLFTHPQATDLAKQDGLIASQLMKGKTMAVRHNGRAIKIAEFKCFVMHSQEASMIDILDSDGLLIAFYANGQFWDSLTKTLIELR